MKQVSERQKNILAFIKAYKEEFDYTPSYREIGNAVGLSSVATVAYQLHELAAKGLVSIREGRQRAIKLVGDNE